MPWLSRRRRQPAPLKATSAGVGHRSSSMPFAITDPRAGSPEPSEAVKCRRREAPTPASSGSACCSACSLAGSSVQGWGQAAEQDRHETVHDKFGVTEHSQAESELRHLCPQPHSPDRRSWREFSIVPGPALLPACIASCHTQPISVFAMTPIHPSPLHVSLKTMNNLGLFIEKNHP